MIAGLAKRVLRGTARSLGLIIAKPQGLYAQWEPFQVRRFLDCFAVDLVLDIGANAGQYATMLRTRAGYRGPLISCEPLPDLALKLQKMSARDPNWIIEPCAVSRKPGRATLNQMAHDQFSSLANSGSTGAALFREEMTVVKRIDVDCTTVADLIGKYASQFNSKSVYVKVDTQGTERFVVEGADPCLDLICGFQLELSFKNIYEGSWSFQETIQELQQRGFELTALFPNNAGHFPTLVEMDGIFHNTAFPIHERSQSR